MYDLRRGLSMPVERNPKMPEANGADMESELRDLVHSSSATSIVPKVQDYTTPAEAKMIGAAVSIAAHGVQEAIARRNQNRGRRVGAPGRRGRRHDLAEKLALRRESDRVDAGSPGSAETFRRGVGARRELLAQNATKIASVGLFSIS
jgi:hypothetical protein